MSYILALDQGTTSSRAILFDRRGSVVSAAQKEFEQIYPRPGWVEHDPNDIWDSQMEVAAKALARAGANPADIAAVGIANQRETTVVWDRRTGTPVYNAIVWLDRRIASYTDQLKGEGYEDRFRDMTGLVLDPYFSGTKVKWILDNVDGARAKAERGELAFGTVDSWLVWRMTTGEAHVTDATNASRTLMYNIHRKRWDTELLDILGIPPSMLPEVRSSSEVYGETAGELFNGRIPIAGMAGDQHAALFGQVCTRRGMVKNTYGTGCFMLMNTGSRPVASRHKLLTTIAWQVEGRTDYALEGSVFIGGAVVQWLRDEVGLISSSNEIEKLAREVEESDGVYVVPAFAGLGAPHWDPHARGIITGITRGTSAAHLARAALESIAFQSSDLLHAMQVDAGMQIEELRVDGGASVNDLLMQFQADVMDVPVVRPRVTETTALGAAYLAGLAVGFWQDRDEIAGQWQVDQVFRPRMPSDRREQLLAGWARAVAQARSPALHSPASAQV